MCSTVTIPVIDLVNSQHGEDFLLNVRRILTKKNRFFYRIPVPSNTFFCLTNELSKSDKMIFVLMIQSVCFTVVFWVFYDVLLTVFGALTVRIFHSMYNFLTDVKYVAYVLAIKNNWKVMTF